MGHRRISMADLVVGQPISWDVYDAANRLLLRKGHVVERRGQIEALIQRGLFIDAGGTERTSSAPQAQETPSVLRQVNAINKRLEQLLPSLDTEKEVQKKILETAGSLIVAVRTNPDIALACILLNQGTASYAVRHSVDTAVVSALVARTLGKTEDEIQAIVAAALTMNIGMLQHQDRLNSKQGPLTPEEMGLIRNHPQESIRRLKVAGVDHEDWLNYVLMHHENEDGSGYPMGKSGDQIPANAKIISLADRYCARVSMRSHRKSLLPNAALRDILLADKKNIAPQLAATFIRELGTYPAGTFVRLENGEIGVVTGKGESSTTPVVHALVGPRGAPLSFPIKRHTDKPLQAIREVLSEEQAAVRVSMQQLWGDEARL